MIRGLVEIYTDMLMPFITSKFDEEKKRILIAEITEACSDDDLYQFIQEFQSSEEARQERIEPMQELVEVFEEEENAPYIHKNYRTIKFNGYEFTYDRSLNILPYLDRLNELGEKLAEIEKDEHRFMLEIDENDCICICP